MNDKTKAAAVVNPAAEIDAEAYEPMAFPMAEQAGIYGVQFGMTLRDYFAGQVVAGTDMVRLSAPDVAATMAYRIADAMMIEREKS